MSSRIFVTGATGFVGGHLCRRLAAEGHRVKALVRRRSQEQALRDQGIDPVRGDLGDPSAFEQALEGIDLVYHLAVDFRSGRSSSRELAATNVSGARRLVEAAARAGVGRFVHCSSVGVHGEVLDPPANEESPFNPGDPYQRSKLDGELAVKETAAKTGLPLVVFRPAGVYGPGDRRFLKLVRALEKPLFPMIGRGEVVYQMVYVDDLIQGVLACGLDPRAVGNTYILTGQRATTVNELIEVVAMALGKEPRIVHLPVAPVYLASAAIELLCAPFPIEPPLFRRRLDLFRKNRSFDISKARLELGYDPGTTLAEGFRKTIAWYRGQGLVR